MQAKNLPMGQNELRQQVLNSDLCTNCGACVNLCPYFAYYKDHTVIVDQCDREEGRCYAFCPRTETDLAHLRRRLFDPEDLTPELGPVKGFYMTRAADEAVRRSAQHGGTVTTLMTLALQEGIIDTAVVAGDDGTLQPGGVAAQKPSEILKHAKSKFVVSPTVATFHAVAKTDVEKIGVVATPCQALALAKMRAKPIPDKDSHIDKLQLVVGLFCGWALSWRELKDLLRQELKEEDILGLDIPPSQYHSLEVHTRSGMVEISLDRVLPCVREACQYCDDMTAEFSDISVGSARSPEGWQAARSWNQVIVRSTRGVDLIERARRRGLLEFCDIPTGNLTKLKKAARNKHQFAHARLAEKKR